jgi:hypothetical protein
LIGNRNQHRGGGLARQLRAKFDRLARRVCTVLNLIYWTSVLQLGGSGCRLRFATKPANNSPVPMVGNGGVAFSAARTAKNLDEVRAYMARLFYSDLPILVLASLDPGNSVNDAYLDRVKAIDQVLAERHRLYLVLRTDVRSAPTLTRRAKKLWVLETPDRHPLGEAVLTTLLELGASAYLHSFSGLIAHSVQKLLAHRTGALVLDLHRLVPGGLDELADALGRYCALDRIDWLVCASERTAIQFAARYGPVRNEPIICPVSPKFDDQTSRQILRAVAPREPVHAKLDVFKDRGFVVLRDYDGPRIPQQEWLSLEYLNWKSGGDTSFAPIASAHGEMECAGFWDYGKSDKNGVWTKNAEKCPTLVQWAKRVGANFGRVRVVKLNPSTEIEASLNLHRDNNNALNPSGEGWVVRAWLELTDDANSYMLLREDKNNVSTETRITLPRNRQVVIDSQRLYHAVWHPGPESRYALIVSFESSEALDRWIRGQSA